jgi:hypothetical protein
VKNEIETAGEIPSSQRWALPDEIAQSETPETGTFPSQKAVPGSR